ncbi:MAG: threonine synthase, partial [Actinomycetota bacterium]|nr:threonine synthase [Actinomycetota bacterium]
PEEEVAEGMRLLARTEGLFTETAGGVTIKALERLVADGRITADQEVVALITGTGLKTLEALEGSPPPDRIQPTTDDVDRLLEQGI